MKRIGLNGCFDSLHAGHLFMLGMAHALAEGGQVIVGINCDAYIRKHIRDNFQDSVVRRQTLLNTGIVDSVQIFLEDNPVNFIHNIEPDIYLIGEEYRGKAELAQ